MCHACWTRYTGGTAPPFTEDMGRAQELVRRIFATEWGCTGGPLHVEIEDMNLDDWHFTAERREKLAKTINAYYPLLNKRRHRQDRQLVYDAFDALAKLTPAERAEVAVDVY